MKGSFQSIQDSVPGPTAHAPAPQRQHAGTWPVAPRARAAPPRARGSRGRRCPAPPPHCAATAHGRCGGSRCLRCGAETRPQSRPEQLPACWPPQRTRARRSRARRCAGRTCSRADQLAVVAAIDAVAQQGAQFQRNRSGVLDRSGRKCSAAHPAGRAPTMAWVGQTADAGACNCRSGDATGALCGKATSTKISPRKNMEPAYAVQRQRVLAAPAQAAARGQLDFQHRRGVGKRAIAQRARRAAAKRSRKLLQAAGAAPCGSPARCAYTETTRLTGRPQARHFHVPASRFGRVAGQVVHARGNARSAPGTSTVRAAARCGACRCR